MTFSRFLSSRLFTNLCGAAVLAIAFVSYGHSAFAAGCSGEGLYNRATERWFCSTGSGYSCTAAADGSQVIWHYTGCTKAVAFNYTDPE